MDLIEHTYSLQWVGPMNYEELMDYCKNEETIGESCFNLYYFEVRKDARYKWKKYFGIHKGNDGICKRLNKSHEHLGPFLKNDAKYVKIWIGSFAKEQDQKTENVDIVETLFIRAYRDVLNDNVKKKKSLPKDSVCIINSYYDINENMAKKKSHKPETFDDVLVYYGEVNKFMHGNLTKM